MVDVESILGLMIPILAVGGWIIPTTFKTVMKSQERRLEMRLKAQQGTNDEVSRQLAALHQEVAALRDTSTQFDMSLEQSVQRLEERVGRVETKAAAQSSAPTTGEQRAGLG